MQEVIVTAISVAGAGLLRSLSGWWENAWADKKVQAYELKLLGVTLVKYLLIGFGLYFGFDMSGMEAAGTAFLLDIALNAFGKTKKK